MRRVEIGMVIDAKTLLTLAIAILSFGITYAIYTGNDKLVVSLISAMSMLIALYKKIEHIEEDTIKRVLLKDEDYRRLKEVEPKGLLDEIGYFLEFLEYFKKKYPKLWVFLRVLFWMIVSEILHRFFFDKSIFSYLEFYSKNL